VPFLPEAAHGQSMVAILGVYAGSVEDGAAAVRPLRALAEPLADLMGPMPYTAMQSLLDPLWAAGAQNHFTAALLDRLTDETIDTLLAHHAAGRAPVRELHPGPRRPSRPVAGRGVGGPATVGARPPVPLVRARRWVHCWAGPASSSVSPGSGPAGA
jgi:hypothetical protein